MGRCPGDEPLTLTIYHSCELPQLYKALERWKSVLAKPTTYGHKWEFFSFPVCLVLLLFYFRLFHGIMRADPAIAGSG